MSRFMLICMLLVAMIIIGCSEDSDDTANPDPQTFTPDGMVLIEAENQSFSMGSENGFSDEMPVHTVSFSYNFWMDTTEVTQKQYEDLMSASYDGYFSPSWNSPYGEGDNYPAYEVSWYDCVLYCNARSREDDLDSVYTYSEILGTPGALCELSDIEVDLSKNGYRLPTEAEWEFACRAGSSTEFFWGADYDPYPETTADTTEISTYSAWAMNRWIYGTSSEFYGTAEVASFDANDFGLYDMAGNVYEWVNDWYGEYSDGSETDPQGPETGEWRFARGGSWGNEATYLRSANRTFSNPDYYYYFLGFRTVINEQ